MASVLIVDDEPGIRRLLARWIGDVGHHVSEAASAEEALEHMAVEPADIVFCDVSMPGRDGLWLTEQLRARFAKSAIILATGISTVPPRHSLRGGVLAYLVKPFSCRDAVNAVEVGVRWHSEAAYGKPAPDLGTDPVTDWVDSLEPEWRLGS
jgi:DNA-binding NtrC family response regulator